jgi:hypothetical protein
MEACCLMAWFLLFAHPAFIYLFIFIEPKTTGPAMAPLTTVFAVPYQSLIMKMPYRAGEMAQRLKALTILPEDLGSIPHTHLEPIIIYNSITQTYRQKFRKQKCPINLPTAQSYKGIFSTAVAVPKMTLVCVQLT